ncbi:hypothetical protein DUI87_24941 [Hirundo rustica rustica]|uniref:Uncharacterized protein n=1 Tax=Hirundo rustica rustica TaxID=333673 RepID=A0A3M0JCP1_HIRRU|nr:hypothetical protein DUI87_24941 [Hirundo rustica rustica]
MPMPVVKGFVYVLRSGEGQLSPLMLPYRILEEAAQSDSTEGKPAPTMIVIPQTMEFGLSDTDGIQADEKVRSRHSNHVQPGQGEGLVLRDLEAFSPDLLDTEKAAILQHSLQQQQHFLLSILH